MLAFLRREKAKDPFGGDDLFDGESRFAGKGPKIALAASVVMFLMLAGGIAAIVLTGKATPPPVAGSLTDIQIVDEAPADTAAPAPANAPNAPPKTASTAATAPVANDATAATDRSAERRPWLSAAPGTDQSPRLGVGDTAKPTAPAPASKQPLMTPPEKSAPIAVAANTPPPANVPASKAPAPQSKTAPEPAPAKSTETPKDAPKDVANADPFGPAPGAPAHIDTSTADAGPTIAGGRPRLVEPALPPTDKTDVTAPPPRFANLVDFKKDTAKTPPPGAAKVAVVIEDLGLNQAATQAAIDKLPPAVTLAFSPYAHNLKQWMDKAKTGGHEVLIEVPMESKSFPADDPGPLGLMTTLDQKDNQERLDTILKQAGPAVGVLDTEGSKFRESDQNIAAVFAALKQHNLFYVQGRPGVRVGQATVPVAVSDVVLDERPFRADVDARLDYAERLAKYQGSVVASLGAKPVGFERLVLWLDQAQKKGVTLAPISQVLIK